MDVQRKEIIPGHYGGLSNHKRNTFIRPSIMTDDDEDVVDYSKALKRPQIRAAISAALGAYVVGCNLGWSSSVQPQLQHNGTRREDTVGTIWDVKLDADEMSWAASLVNIGASLGSLFGGFLMDTFGRRAALMSMAGLYMVEWLLITLAVEPSMLYLGRLIGGLAVGVSSIVVPTYIGEISTPSQREMLGSLIMFHVGLGVLLTTVLVRLNWRWISCILGFQPIMFLITLYFAPESPYYLVKKGELFYAQNCLLWLRGPKFNVAAELKQIEDRVQQDEKHGARFSELVRPWAVKPVLIGFAMMIFLQFSGLNAIIFYSAEILRLSKTVPDPGICSFSLAFVSMTSLALSGFVMGRCNRRTVFIISELLTLLSIGVLGCFFFILDVDKKMASTLNWLPLTSMLIFVSAANLGLTPSAWIVSYEILPDRLKGPGSYIASFFHWSACFVITRTFNDLQRDLGIAGTFWLYGFFSFSGILFGIFLLPETKGKTSDEIEALLYS